MECRIVGSSSGHHCASPLPHSVLSIPPHHSPVKRGYRLHRCSRDQKNSGDRCPFPQQVSRGCGINNGRKGGLGWVRAADGRHLCLSYIRSRGES
ncbi:hypothetical protein E2C01_002361 [Portunus trituberculatus]|uniref:Uncharacterized protein n=1 Tax=Portunus trituberculatus TaxID=210409 RepID=A0A5B7CJ65_PORTR|nr:hypothetical protein [Portunus trituberculatus]